MSPEEAARDAAERARIAMEARAVHLADYLSIMVAGGRIELDDYGMRRLEAYRAADKAHEEAHAAAYPKEPAQ